MNKHRIEARDKEATLYLYDDIGFGGIQAKQVIDDLAKINAKTLNVRINSAGGDVFEGVAIYNALARQQSRVITHVDGLAASIASVIAMAGEEIHMAETAMMMIHRAWGIAAGDADFMRGYAVTLDQVDQMISGVYSRRTGRTVDEVMAMMAAETWMKADEAVAAGFATGTTEPQKIAAAKWNPEKWKNMMPNMELLQFEQPPTKPVPVCHDLVRRKIELTKMQAQRMNN